MATDWQPLSDATGRIAGIASLSLYQNLRLPLPEPAVPLPPPPPLLSPPLLPSCQLRIDNRSRQISPVSRRFAIVAVVLGSPFVATTIVRVGSDDSCFNTAHTLASVQMLPKEAGLSMTMTRRAVAACGPISKLPATWKTVYFRFVLLEKESEIENWRRIFVLKSLLKTFIFKQKFFNIFLSFFETRKRGIIFSKISVFPEEKNKKFFSIESFYNFSFRNSNFFMKQFFSHWIFRIFKSRKDLKYLNSNFGE